MIKDSNWKRINIFEPQTETIRECTIPRLMQRNIRTGRTCMRSVEKALSQQKNQYI